MTDKLDELVEEVARIREELKEVDELKRALGMKPLNVLLEEARQAEREKMANEIESDMPKITRFGALQYIRDFANLLKEEQMTQDNRLLTKEECKEIRERVYKELNYDPLIVDVSLLIIASANIQLETREAQDTKTYKALLESPMLLDWLRSAIESHDAATRMIMRNKLEEAHDKGFKEGVEKTTIACNSTFGSMLEEAKKQTAEEIKRELEEPIRLMEKVIPKEHKAMVEWVVKSRDSVYTNVGVAYELIKELQVKLSGKGG